MLEPWLHNHANCGRCFRISDLEPGPRGGLCETEGRQKGLKAAGASLPRELRERDNIPTDIDP
jgi:hypothetical protein